MKSVMLVRPSTTFTTTLPTLTSEQFRSATPNKPLEGKLDLPKGDFIEVKYQRASTCFSNLTAPTVIICPGNDGLMGSNNIAILAKGYLERGVNRSLA